MERLSKSVVVLMMAVFFVFTLAVDAQAIDVVVLPDQKIVSVDSPVVIKVDPKTTETPMRITWSLYNAGEKGTGSFPLVDGKGLCYFSNTDGNATCGPSPFFSVGETELYVYVITPSRISNETLPINITPTNIPMDGVNRVDNTVFLYIYIAKKDLMKYSIYKEDLTIYQSDRPLDYNTQLGRYEGNITLNPGVYYFTFFMNDSGNYGATLKRIEIPSSDFLNIQTNKQEYWLGEKITISGTTNANKVVGEVRFPDGSKALDFSIDVLANRTFSYSFYPQSDWPEGTYEIKTSKPFSKSLNFSITEFFQITPESIDKTVNKSDSFTASITIKNIRNNATNISFDVSGGLNKNYVTLSKNYLEPQETASITISIPSVQNKIEGMIIIKTPEGLEVKIPVSINAIEQIECQQGEVETEALEIDSDSLVLAKECMAGETITHSVKLINKGNVELSNFTYSVEDVKTGFSDEKSLKYLDVSGGVNIDLQNLSLEPGSSQEIEISVIPDEAGKYYGVINFISGDAKASLFVALTCFENISDKISELEGKLADLNLPEDISEDIQNQLNGAKNSLALENYADAYEKYMGAEAKLQVLKTTGGMKFDLTIPIIIIVVIVVVLLLLWVFKFRKPKISELSEEEIVSEEF